MGVTEWMKHTLLLGTDSLKVFSDSFWEAGHRLVARFGVHVNVRYRIGEHCAGAVSRQDGGRVLLRREVAGKVVRAVHGCRVVFQAEHGQSVANARLADPILTLKPLSNPYGGHSF